MSGEFRLSWRGQPEPGVFATIEDAKAYAESNSHKNSGHDADRLTWHEEPSGARGLWWGSDGYNNWLIYEETPEEADPAPNLAAAAAKPRAFRWENVKAAKFGETT